MNAFISKTSSSEGVLLAFGVFFVIMTVEFQGE